MTGLATTRRMIALGVVAVTVLAGCTSTDGGTKAGGGDAPVTLRMGTDDMPGLPAADQIEEFARQVDELSQGRLVIESAWNAAGESGGDDWDQKVARMVVAGEIEMGMIPARAWDTEGVTSLRALNAPFLITSDELAAEVATSEAADTMLAGLDTVGVTGLALLPEGLRHLFAFSNPLLTPDDFTGQLIRVPASNTAHATFEALGATPDDATAGEDAIVAGDVAAAESSFDLAPNLPETTTGTSNITLYPKYNSIVINTSTWTSLPEDLQAVLRDAAQRTRSWAIDTLPDEAAAAAEFCRKGGRVVTADAKSIAAMENAVQPVYAELETDPTTRTLIEQIRALNASTDAAATLIQPCGPDAVAPSPSNTKRDTTAFPQGVFRTELSRELFLDAGLNEFETNLHAGLWTLTFADGQLSITDVNASTGQEHTDTGTYCVEKGRIALGIPAFAKKGSDSPCDTFWDAAWTLDGDQLRLLDVKAEDSYPLLLATIFASRPFTRIG
jgi:C4-dicarboxylate-binding protein DctP